MKINFTNTTNTLEVQQLETLYVIPVALDEIHIPFVFDTGATMTSMSQTTAARLNAITDSETVKCGGNSGSTFIANTAIIPVLQIGDITIEELRVIVVEDEQLDFGETENGNHLIINGFLGWDIIQHFKWQYNKNENCINISKSMQEQVPSNMEEWDNMPILRVIISGKEEVFGFDTGNTESILGDRMYHKYSNSSEGSDVFSGVDGIKEENVRIVEDFSFLICGELVTLNQVSAIDRQVFPSENKQINGLLGADILKGKSWTLDYGNRFLDIRSESSKV